MTQPRILIVEDNADLADGLRYNLELEGYGVSVLGDGRAAIARVRAEAPDLMILDLMLPGCDGYEVLRAIREAGARLPVIILSARGEEADKVRGFRLDADQYVTKPVGLLELLERVRALLRRATPGHRNDTGPVLRFGVVQVEPASRTVTVAGEPVGLTPKAFDLMLALIRRKGAVASRGDLLAEVWGAAPDVFTRTVDSHIAELRRKLEPDPAEPRHFVTVWKAGYRFQP